MSVCFNDTQWIRYNDHQKRMRCFLRFFTSFAVNTSMKDESITSQQRYESNNMKSWKTRVNMSLSHSQFNSSSSQISVCSSARRQCVVFSIFAVNQNASINKNSKSSNSRNLRQHTFAKSISFCLCFVLRNRSFHHINLQIFSRSKFSFKILILVIAYIYSRFLAHLLLSHLSLHVYRICFESFSFNNDLHDIYASVNELLCNVDR